MNRPHILLSTFALSSAVLLPLQTQEVKAMNIAFDCFERSSEKLVARSAVDITSTSISCLPVPGSTLADDSSSDSDNADMLVEDITTDEDLDQDDDSDIDIADNGIDDEVDFEEDDGEASPESSTGSQLGDAVGQHLGKLIGKGFADLFR
jgi:hypothetical protein